MKKLAFIDLTNFHNWPMGGMLEYELTLLSELTKSFDIDIWGVSVDGIRPEPIVIDNKVFPINIFANVKTKNKIIPNYLRGLLTYRIKKLANNKYDYYYARTGSCMVGVKPFKGDSKLIYQQHGLNYLNDKSIMQSIQRPFYTLAQRAADLVFVVSDLKSVNKYERYMKRRHHINAKYIAVKSPINVDQFNETYIQKRIRQTQGENIKKLIYTGRLSKFKNAKLLIDVFNKYQTEIEPSATLTIVGSGEEEELLRKKIEKLNLEKKVKLTGAVAHDEIYKLLIRSDAFLTASGGEGVSVSVAEAYAAGLPVVCFRVPGLEKQVINNVTGKIAVDNTMDAFFIALKDLNANYVQMANNCLLEAKKYSVKNVSKVIKDNILDL